MTLRIGSLCAGYGGLDMGVSMIIDAEPVWFCEFAAGPSKILAHRYPGVPNHHDLTATDWNSVEPVDVITAGWPCQPWSMAGTRKGANDERAIWPAIADAICCIRPRYVALENVSAIVGAGELARAVGDLASLGYDSQWQCVRASDVGAPHRRERCFILATDPRSEAVELRSGLRTDVSPRIWRSRSDDGGGAAADAVSGGRKRRGPVQLDGASVDFAGDGAIDWGSYGPAIRKWEGGIGRTAPDPTEPTRTGTRRLSPLLVEWMMGLPEGWVTAVPDLSRNEQLKALGNGVVPQQAAAAYASMLALN